MTPQPEQRGPPPHRAEDAVGDPTPPGLTSFPPGDAQHFILPSRWGGQSRSARLQPVGAVCEVEVPSRLHASVIDMNRFAVGVPGGGGIGFAVALFCRARVVRTVGQGVSAAGNRPGIALHLVRLFQALTGCEGGFEIELNDHGRRHMGLGSSIGTITAAGVALNEVCGRPLSLRDLRLLIAHNYCEETPGSPVRLVSGFETNVGAMAGIHGGMVVASDHCELIYRSPLPDAMRALLILPNTGPEVASGEGEARALLTEARDLDRIDAQAKAYKILMELLPAMVRGDMATVGEVIFALARIGSKKAECALHGRQGEEIYRTLGQLRDQGAEIVSMSSVGPAVFALSSRPEVWRGWERWKARGAAACALDVPVDNTGVRVRLDGVPVPYRFDPWWSEPDYQAAPATTDPALGYPDPGDGSQFPEPAP